MLLEKGTLTWRVRNLSQFIKVRNKTPWTRFRAPEMDHRPRKLRAQAFNVPNLSRLRTEPRTQPPDFSRTWNIQVSHISQSQKRSNLTTNGRTMDKCKVIVLATGQQWSVARRQRFWHHCLPSPR